MAEEFDYVIVGAGSAGCTLAARLSEERDLRILLLEAGGWDRDPFIHIPLGWGRILQNRLHDWMYFCEPEPNVDHRRVECARGKVVGGSSSINAMAYVRGHPGDYDRWARQYGLAEWSYAQVLPYFRRQESWESGGSAVRGGDGPIAVQRCRYQDPLVAAYIAAARSAGHPWTDDYNGANQEGFSRLQMTIAHGRRCSAATAYLHPALRQRHLTVRVKVLATKVVIEHDRAVGVEYFDRGTPRVVRAARAVILAAGVINSPHLLMLSGIGEPDQLRMHGIEVRVALPGVGRNLQDHVSAIVMYRRKLPGPFHRMLRYDRIARALVQAYVFGRGFAADVPGGVTAFLRSGPGPVLPDIQLLLTAAPLAAWPYLVPFRAPFPDGFAARTVLIHPESRGSITLASADPAAAPRINQNFLGTAHEWRALRCAVRIARGIAAEPALTPYVEREISPGPDCVSDAEIDAYIRRTAITMHHPAGTCRMGSDADPLAVVDTVLAVRGLGGLRVVDASVMPDLPGGNINAAVIMIAERAADLIQGRELLRGGAAERVPDRPDRHRSVRGAADQLRPG